MDGSAIILKTINRRDKDINFDTQTNNKCSHDKLIFRLNQIITKNKNYVDSL